MGLNALLWRTVDTGPPPPVSSDQSRVAVSSLEVRFSRSDLWSALTFRGGGGGAAKHIDFSSFFVLFFFITELPGIPRKKEARFVFDSKEGNKKRVSRRMSRNGKNSSKNHALWLPAKINRSSSYLSINNSMSESKSKKGSPKRRKGDNDRAGEPISNGLRGRCLSTAPRSRDSIFFSRVAPPPFWGI